MIVNVIDDRTNNFQVVCNALFEPACLDNGIEGATKHINDTSDFYVLHNVSIVEALECGVNLQGSYTLTFEDVVEKDA